MPFVRKSKVGALVLVVGPRLGTCEGRANGEDVSKLGETLGIEDVIEGRENDGESIGCILGETVGAVVGNTVGLQEGSTDGRDVGAVVGEILG